MNEFGVRYRLVTLHWQMLSGAFTSTPFWYWRLEGHGNIGLMIGNVLSISQMEYRENTVRV